MGYIAIFSFCVGTLCFKKKLMVSIKLYIQTEIFPYVIDFYQKLYMIFLYIIC